MEKKATATTLMVVVFFLAIFSLPAPAKAGIGEEIAGLFLGLAVDAIGTAVQAGAERSIIEAETRRRQGYIRFRLLRMFLCRKLSIGLRVAACRPDSCSTTGVKALKSFMD